MITRSKIKNTLIALSGTLLLGAFAQVTPAQAAHRGWGGYDRHVVHRHVVHRPLVRHVVVHRPIVYRPRPIVRRVVIVERPFYPRVRYSYGWRHRVGYRHAWHRRWHDHRRCFLPERYLCR